MASPTIAVDISCAASAGLPIEIKKLPNVPAASNAACWDCHRGRCRSDHEMMSAAPAPNTTDAFDIDSLKSDAASTDAYAHHKGASAEASQAMPAPLATDPTFDPNPDIFPSAVAIARFRSQVSP